MTTPQDQPSANTRPPSRMVLVGERQLPDPPQSPSLTSLISSAQTTTTNTPTEYIHRAAWKAGVLGALNVIVLVTAVRLILLVSVCGAIALAFLALQQPDPYRLGALTIYTLLVVGPVAWLSSRR